MKTGKYCVIEDGVIIGKNTELKNYVELRTGTVIGEDCYIDSRVSTSGDCFIGDRVRIRYSGIIARGTIIDDDVFIAPQLMTENVDHRGEEVGGAQIGVGEWDRKTKYRVFIGTNVTLAAGITICPGVVIGSKSNVRKSIDEPGVYFGNPARKRGG